MAIIIQHQAAWEVWAQEEDPNQSQSGNPRTQPTESPAGTGCRDEYPEALGGAEGQNSDFRVWICEEEGVVKGSWRCRGRGRGRRAAAREDPGVCP